MASRLGVFIDRDGTLTEEVGYVNHPTRLQLLPRAAQAVRALNSAGVAAVVVTNQAGVARGYFSEEVLHAVNAELIAQLKQAGAHLDGIYVCPHHPTDGQPPYRADCDCRKPKPGLLLRAASELGLDLRASAVVGDKPSDLVVAGAVGARSVLVLTGYGRGEWEYRRASFPAMPDHVASDLLDAVEWILGERAR
ncbi:MAG: D,D-heptose 1,7-bisphosphate phosphatase [Candidatus Rokubacteria bacterium 13_1_40CM_69_27]|nr:MAG: D,D-heptose 1,7-bisphosphate phosphatase [Candidatus Rokubacteria bacterium 13_1_40CM_69_27]